jgi:hypothetical protein
MQPLAKFRAITQHKAQPEDNMKSAMIAQGHFCLEKSADSEELPARREQ